MKPAKQNPKAQAAARRFWTLPETRLWLGDYKKLAVGVSGGLDSMTLLWLLAHPERPSWAPHLVTAHIHHGLRGD